MLNYVELLKRRYRTKVDAEGQRLISCVADRAAQVHSTMDEFCRALEHLCQEYMEPAVLASEAQLLVARDIQQKLFPSCAPNLDGYDIAPLPDSEDDFTILAPHQAELISNGDGNWSRAADGFDLGVPYRYEHTDGSGRSLAVFFYDPDGRSYRDRLRGRW